MWRSASTRMVPVRSCSRCPATLSDAIYVVGRERLCASCVGGMMDATTIDVDGAAGLLHEMPSPVKRRPSSGRQRDLRRNRAQRAAAQRLRLLHLQEFEAIYAEELHRVGLRPAVGQSFAVHLRKLAGKRLQSLTERAVNG